MVMTDGVHGPTLAPYEMLFVNAGLLAVCFYLLCRPTKSAGREILVLATIGVAGAASRVLLEPFPNVQPLTVMCLVMGATLGARRGMAFAVIATILSNIILSHGWWTLFQASGWAAVAFTGSRLNLISKNSVNMSKLIPVAIVSSILFDWWVSLSIYTPGMTLSEFGIYILNGLPFDALHALASVVSAVWIAPWLTNLLFAEVDDLVVKIPVGDCDVNATQ